MSEETITTKRYHEGNCIFREEKECKHQYRHNYWASEDIRKEHQYIGPSVDQKEFLPWTSHFEASRWHPPQNGLEKRLSSGLHWLTPSSLLLCPPSCLCVFWVELYNSNGSIECAGGEARGRRWKGESEGGHSSASLHRKRKEREWVYRLPFRDRAGDWWRPQL